MKKYIAYVLLLVAFQQITAQEVLIQWTGIVRNDLLEPLPYVHVIAKKNYRGTVSDPQGAFTIITFPRDTLLISCMGYKPMKIPVPNVSNSQHYIKDIIMQTDTIMLSEVVIVPWKTYKEFKEAFIALELPEDDLLRAYRNIAIMQAQMQNVVANRPASPTSNFRDFTNSRYNQMMAYGNVLPTYSITNPFAWAQFFQALRNGEFKKKEDQSNQSSVLEEHNQATK